VHHFSAGGLYNGLVLLIDDETRSHWDHVTGEAIHGPLKGKVLDVWHTPITNVRTALAEDPQLELSTSTLRLWWRVFSWISKPLWGREKGFIPPFFRRTMGAADDRLPEHTRGLGVVVDRRARFYPMSAIGDGVRDLWGERSLRIWIDDRDGAPRAEWEDGGAPMQLFARWYGFARTYPECGVFGR